MMGVRQALFLLSAFLLFGCATSPERYQPSTLKQQLALANDSTYQVKSPFGVVWTIGLHPGLYKPELEGEGGVFFRGPERCVIFQPGDNSVPTTTVGGVFPNREGGIWIPNDKALTQGFTSMKAMTTTLLKRVADL